MRLRAAALVAACLILGPATSARATPSHAAGAPGSTSAALASPPGVPSKPDQLLLPPEEDRPPPRHMRSAREVVKVADRQPRVREALRRHPGASGVAYEKGPSQWQVSYFTPERPGRPGQPGAERQEIAQVLIDDRTRAVLEAWNGYQVAWTMARGYPGAFGRKVSAVYVWIPLALLFVLPFARWRRPLCLRNLDLLVLVGFSASLAFFSHGQIGVSVPLAYPPLLYLLVRMLVLARARARAGPPGGAGETPPQRLAVPVTWLAVGLVFLISFRVGLNVVNSNVIDVGYAGVIGANQLVHGKPLYGSFPHDNDHGDTYGPVAYLGYVPFERIWPWSGTWNDLPAAHGAAVFFDLLTILLLWLLGRRVRGPTLGVALAYAWAAYPFTLFTANSNSNDSLVAALVVAALLAATSPVGRGILSALAGLAKFAPLALAPMMALYGGGEGGQRRLTVGRLLAFVAAFALTAAAVLVPAALGSGLRVFYERTVVYQVGRSSPFSVWGLVPGLGGVHVGVQVAAVVLALVVALFPRRRDLVTLAALSGAVLVAVQLTMTHWFYLYIVWFLPAVLVALLAEDLVPAWRRAVRPPPALAPPPALSPVPASALSR